MEINCKFCQKNIKTLDENDEFEKKIIEFLTPYYADLVFFCSDEHDFEMYSTFKTEEELNYYKSDKNFYKYHNFSNFVKRYIKKEEV